VTTAEPLFRRDGNGAVLAGLSDEQGEFASSARSLIFERRSR
jgi:hypothetical protein